MMETITISTNSSHQIHVADLDDHSPVDDDQMMNLSDMADLSQEMQEVVIPKEVILISLVSQQQALYNPKHENYRNTQRKDMKWMEISEHVGWTEMQCKAKWKAMRDQYCRELKRSKFNVKANVKWKYFKELDFLRPYALARNYRPRNPTPANNNNNSSSSSNINHNNSFNCSATIAASASDLHQSDNNNTTKITTIKLENNAATASFATCDFSTIKSDATSNLTDEQLNNVLQHQADDNNWTYITGSSTSSNNNSRLDNHSLNDPTHLLTTHHHHPHHQQQTDEALLYNALVDCVGQIQQQQQLCHQQTTTTSQHHHHQQQATINNDEEDDDPIHTFLNIESYFEKELIALIQHEDVLYNSFHPNYRNVKLKLEVWDEIARKLKKTVKQCRLKWKALRDQFIREHKRLKNRDNIESLPRWKHYDALSFLQKFIKHKAGDYENKNLLQITKTEIEADMDDDDEHMNISGSSPLRSPMETIKCEISRHIEIPDLETVDTHHPSLHHHQQQQQEHADSLCVTTGSVGDYDDMDIDNYIIGDSGSVVDEHNEHEEQDAETADEHKSQHDFSVYANHNEEDESATNASLDEANQAFESNSGLTQNLHAAAANDHQSHHLHHQQQQQHTQQPQHISMPSLDLSDNTSMISSENVKTSNAINQSYQSATLTNGPSLSLASSLDLCTAAVVSSTAAAAPATPAPPTTTEASTNTQPLAAGISNNSVNSEDDEVGAFFKAVAMKIRNAKLSPVAFTDLQINILRVINGSLRNH